MDIVFIPNKTLVDPFEYWCYGCKKLYLSYVETKICNHCGHSKILIGACGELDKEVFNLG